MNPLHEDVREQILQRIEGGTYVEGGPIPSTAQLGREFNVSPITVKRALRDLQMSGVLTSIPGKGTFVKMQRRFLRELDVGMSSVDDARRHGQKLTVRLLSVTRETITEPVLLTLDGSGSLKLCVRKIVYADDVPVMYDSTYVSTETPDSIVEGFGDGLVTEALTRNGIELAETRLIIDAAPASVAAQSAFSIPAGYPVLRRAYHQKTTRVDLEIVGIVESPFDRLACSVTLPIRRRDGFST